MKPTEILSSEHRVIERVLDVLDELATRARAQQSIDLDAASKALRVLRTFADECHHGKEEQRLFPRMEQRGLPTHVGPVAVMLHEHELGRAAIRALGQALEGGRLRDPNAPEKFAFHVGEYTSLLREHIAKEDQVLFPMAESMLTDADREDLLRQFAEMETKELAGGTHEAMMNLVDELCAKFQIKASTSTPIVHVCGRGKR